MMALTTEVELLTRQKINAVCSNFRMEDGKIVLDDITLTKEQIQEVEDLVNDAIKRDLPVTCETMTLDEARNAGAIAFFDSKYGEMVKVYTIGDFSKEVCGGPHVTHTGDMGHFHILKEQSSSAGVRRIKAVLEK